MKNIKKIVSVVLTLALVVSMATVTFAEDLKMSFSPKVDEIHTSEAITDPDILVLVNGQGREFSKDQFKFDLRAVSAQLESGKQMSSTEMPMPEGSDKGVKKFSVKGNGKFNYGDIQFSEPGLYIYEIYQTTDDAPEGYKLDNSKFTITFKVIRNAYGHLVLDREIKKDGQVISAFEEGDEWQLSYLSKAVRHNNFEGDSLFLDNYKFTNTYTAKKTTGGHETARVSCKKKSPKTSTVSFWESLIPACFR